MRPKLIGSRKQPGAEASTVGKLIFLMPSLIEVWQRSPDIGQKAHVRLPVAWHSAWISEPSSRHRVPQER
jgi:hypothetical protein